jgi:AcrR family transcriptional regulator
MQAILDAAAALIADEGTDSLTMQAIAEHARTSNGSLYHFFPDLKSVLAALTDRHVDGLREMNRQLEMDSAERWSRRTTAETIDAALGPLLSYAEQHPDMFPLLRGAAFEESSLRAGALEMIEGILEARLPNATPRDRKLGAKGLIAICSGMASMLGGRQTPRAAFRREMRRALIGYLSALEKEFR